MTISLHSGTHLSTLFPNGSWRYPILRDDDNARQPILYGLREERGDGWILVSPWMYRTIPPICWSRLARMKPDCRHPNSCDAGLLAWTERVSSGHVCISLDIRRNAINCPVMRKYLRLLVLAIDEALACKWGYFKPKLGALPYAARRGFETQYRLDSNPNQAALQSVGL